MPRLTAKLACSVSLASLSALAMFGPVAAPAGATAAKCVISGDTGETQFTKLHGISCTGAKTVGQRAYKNAGGDAMLCGSRTRYAGWTIRHTDSMFLQATFTKGSKRFTMLVQGGAC